LVSVDYSQVHSLAVLENPIIRRGVEDALKRVGFGPVLSVLTVDALHNAMAKTAYDLIILPAEIGGISMAPLIVDMRNGRLGPNPFPIIIILLNSPDQTVVRKIIDSGPDDLLLIPFSPKQLLDRLEGFTRQRKPFVVTQDYTGPDRRSAARPGTEQIPQIGVPNPLMARTRKMPPAQYEKDAARVAAQLDGLKLERYAVQVTWLDKTIRQLFVKDMDVGKLSSYSFRLRQIVEDVGVRVKGTISESLAAVLRDLEASAEALLSDGENLSKVQLEAFSRQSAAFSAEILKQIP